MKFFKKKIFAIGLAGLTIFGLTACDDDFEKINTNPNDPEVAPTNMIFNGATRYLMNYTRDGWWSGRLSLPWMQYSTQYIYIEEDKYNTIPPYEEFFIRPEDVSFYEDYIDTIEFYKDDYYELLEKQNILYKIYNSGKWEGKLSDIIDGYTEDVLNTTVLPSFAKFRVDCQRRCDLGLCDSCKHHTAWAKTLEKSGIKVTTKEVPPDDR